VGESIVYDDAADALVWVDITGRRIQRLALASGEVARWPVDEFPTSIGLRQGGGAIVGLTRGVSLFDFNTFSPLAEIEPDLPDNRLNEGRVDPQGRFMVGTMQNNITAQGAPKDMTDNAGALHLVEADGTVRQLTPNAFGITNTMVWQDGRFIVADTLANALYAYDHDAATGAIANPRSFASGFERGLPDGSCQDAEGFIWNARFGGGCLVRFSPDGAVDRVVDLPCTNPTSCTFGGRDLDTLYVTSARFTLPGERIAQAPWEGGLFAVDAGVRVLP
jgi:sugar lactone lactonase YvrE